MLSITIPELLAITPAWLVVIIVAAVYVIYKWLDAALQGVIKKIIEKASTPKQPLSKEDERYM